LASVGEIARYHRIQASPGYREAAAWCDAAFGAAGLEHRVISFPYDGKETYWTSRSFEEWRITAARLDLVEPQAQARKLCDFEETRISVIQRSGPTPGDGVVAELVALEEPETPASYEGLDLRGKLVLARGDIERIRRLAVESGGALGIVHDGMPEFPPVRDRTDVPDARQYTSFWWEDGAESPCFGFVLSPRQGEWLRGLVKKQAAEGKSVRVRAMVRSSFGAGAIEDVEGLIPGTDGGEVLAVAHLCHPRSSANDNASGCGAVIEAARALSTLISGGMLPPPRRNIRFLLVPEMAGTYAFLSRNESLIPGIAAAINLDMVGENQELCGSSFLVEYPPRALGSFAGDLAAIILESMTDDVPNLAHTSAYGLFRHSVTPFSGGSDHYILADPTVGVPCPMLIQWPDKFYHTSQDTLDKVDPAMLARAAALTATYCYFLAAAGEPEVVWLAGEMAGMFGKEASSAARTALRGGAPERAREQLGFLQDRKLEDLGSLRRLLDGPAPAAEGALSAAGDAVRAIAGVAQDHLMRAFAAAGGGSGSGGPAAGQEARSGSRDSQGEMGKPSDIAGRVPRRTFRGPLARGHLVFGSTPEERDAWTAELTSYLKARGKDPRAAGSLMTYAMYWTDGRRDLTEISRLVALESGWTDLGLLTRLYSHLAEKGLVAWSQ
jgi:hypothetical protein